MRSWFLLSLVLAWPLVGGAQQAPALPPDYQQLLERALTRESSQATLCVQNREDLVKYFQAELRKVMDERDALRKHVASPANGK